MSLVQPLPNWVACRSSLAIDRWLSGELSAAQAEELRAHAGDCARCQPAVAMLRGMAEEPLPPPSFLRPKLVAVEGGSNPIDATNKSETSVNHWPHRSRKAALGAACLAIAASLLIALRHKDTSPETERSKGAPISLDIYVQHGEQVRRALPGESVAPGDAIRFALGSKSGGYAAVLSLDPGSQASIYFPLDARAAPIAGGAEVALPLSTRLDQTRGQEQIFALLCDSPIELEPLRANLQAGSFTLPAGCSLAQQRFEKK